MNFDLFLIGFSIIVFILFVFYCMGIIKLIFIEREINKLYKTKKIKGEEAANNPAGMLESVAKGRKKEAMKEYEEKIEELERKRKFLVEKLTLFKVK